MQLNGRALAQNRHHGGVVGYTTVCRSWTHCFNTVVHIFPKLYTLGPTRSFVLLYLSTLVSQLENMGFILLSTDICISPSSAKCLLLSTLGRLQVIDNLPCGLCSHSRRQNAMIWFFPGQSWELSQSFTVLKVSSRPNQAFSGPRAVTSLTSQPATPIVLIVTLQYLLRRLSSR